MLWLAGILGNCIPVYFSIFFQNFEFITTPLLTSNTIQTFQVEIRVSETFRVIVDIIDYNPDTSEEVFMVYDAPKNAIREDTFRWQVEEDLVEFPVVSTSSVATLSWQVKGPTSERLVLVVRSSELLYYHNWLLGVIMASKWKLKFMTVF